VKRQNYCKKNNPGRRAVFNALLTKTPRRGNLCTYLESSSAYQLGFAVTGVAEERDPLWVRANKPPSPEARCGRLQGFLALASDRYHCKRGDTMYMEIKMKPVLSCSGLRRRRLGGVLHLIIF